MDIDIMKEMNLDEVRILYKEYLNNQNLSLVTINTYSVDAFYLWRKAGADLFWTVMNSDDFEYIAKNELLKVLHNHSKVDANISVNSYMAQLRRFRMFLYDNGSLGVVTIKSKRTPSKSSSRKHRYVPTPSVEIVEEYLKKWDEFENYQLQESALDRLFYELCPENKEIQDVLLKASTLNDFYSTNIFSIYPVAKHICSLNIDERLINGDVTLVGDIQKIEISGVIRNFYSFSTKYCSHHNSQEYPIYDSYVDEVLRHFRRQDKFADFSDLDLKDYALFKSILIEFRKYYNLEKFNLKQIDQYIWQLGKEYFPKNYNKNKTV